MFDRHGIALAFLGTFQIPLGSEGSYLREKHPVFAPEIAVGRSFDTVRIALNLGYRFRSQSKLLDLEVNDEIFLHAGVAYGFHDVGGSAGIPTFDGIGVFSAFHPFSQREQTSWEVRFGGSYECGWITPFVASGFGVLPGYGTPDWRLLIGMKLRGSSYSSEI